MLEGVESEEDFRIAKSLGVDFVQGYIFKHLNLLIKKMPYEAFGSQAQSELYH